MIYKVASLIVSTLLLTACQATSQAATESFADVILTNGNVYAGKIKNPWSSAVAIKDGLIIYVGDDASVHNGEKTKTYDLEGQLVIPGIIDAHTHPGFVARSSGQYVLEEASNKQDLLTAIKKMVAEKPDDKVLIGGYWLNEIFGPEGPHKSDLDSIEATRPLILYDDWAHTVWANSAALAHAGVTKHTADIVPGFSFYKKDENGEPTGWITESAASVFINQFGEVTPEIEATMLEYLNYLRDVGVTSVLDAGNFGMDREVYTAISKFDKQGVLPVRYHGAYTLFTPDGLPNAIENLKALGQDFNTDNVRIDTLKIFSDGVLETRTAALSSDYLDTPGNNGEALLSREQMHDLILELDKEALNLHVHAVGDRSTTIVLDAVEDAHKSLSRAPNIRIAICHLEVVKNEDFPRFKRLGVIGQFTPHWAAGGDLSWNEAGIGDQVNHMQRAQPLLNDGAIVTFSSDITDEGEWKADRANPYLGMQVGHNRQDIYDGESAEILPPLGERIGRRDLVNGYTSNAAFQLGREKDIGTIAVGMRADMVVLDQDLFSVDRYDIHKTKPVAVLVDGEIVVGDLNHD